MHRNSVDLQFLPPYFSYIGNHNAFSVIMLFPVTMLAIK